MLCILKNFRRQTNTGWFGFSFDDVGVCGLTRFQRMAAFFLCFCASIFCFVAVSAY